MAAARAVSLLAHSLCVLHLVMRKLSDTCRDGFALEMSIFPSSWKRILDLLILPMNSFLAGSLSGKASLKPLPETDE